MYKTNFGYITKLIRDDYINYLKKKNINTDMINNPQVYITEVGLYDELGSLIAVGRLSAGLEKNFSSEAIIKVRLTY